MTPQARIPLILEAALYQFAQHGYGATRMEDIAARAGLSKGGVYAHFTSKDEVFGALLQQSLPAPALAPEALVARCDTPEALVQALLDQLYAQLLEPRALAVARLLITEGARLPQVVEPWRQRTLETVQRQISDVLRLAAARGLCHSPLLEREPWLVLSPLVHSVVRLVTLGGLQPVDTLVQDRQAHAELLCALLQR